MSGYFVKFVVGTYQCPRLIGRFRHIRIAMAALHSTSALLHGIVVKSYICATRRVVTGVRMAGFYAVIESWLKEQSPKHLQGQVFAVYTAVTLLAMAVGQFFILPSDVPALNLLRLPPCRLGTQKDYLSYYQGLDHS